MSATSTTGFLHPGAMGASVAAACGGERLWCSQGRSPETAERASEAGLIAVATPSELIERSDLIVSVCPPGAAVSVADMVADLGFEGVYVDANAIAPATARTIAAKFESFVDGGIVGLPAHQPGTTRMYLSGDSAADVAELWSESVLAVLAIEGGPGAASALKVAYATWTKASAAMLLAVRAFARSEGVDDALVAEWEISQPGVRQRSELTAHGVAPKAWRFDGEMVEIAAAFAEQGLPSGFGEASGDIYRRLATLKNEPDVDIDQVIVLLTDWATRGS